MNRIVLFAAALLAFGPLAAHAQTTAPTYQGTDGQTKEAIGTFPVSGGAPRPTGASADQVQGTAANGSATMGSPVTVAGSDGAIVRTLRTDTAGNATVSARIAAAQDGSGNSVASLTGDSRPLMVGGFVLNSANAWDRMRSADGAAGTAGIGLLGVGNLGFASSTPPTAATAGTYTRQWVGLNGQQATMIADANSGAVAAVRTVADAAGLVGGVTVNGQLYAFNGVTYDRIRSATGADATAGTGLLGAGILGQYNGTLPNYASGQFGTVAINQKGQLLVQQYSTASVNTDGVSAGWSGQGSMQVVSQDLMFNGASWDRVRGDTTGGLWTQEKERAQFYAEPVTALAANATYTGATRDGGPNISQWGSFSCWFRSDATSATNGGALQGSSDNVNWVTMQSATVTANVPTRLTERNDMRNHRCVLGNGTTANTVAPVINSSFGA